MKVLVTGATGFLGSHAVAELVQEGHAVRVLARTPAKVPRVLAPLGVATVEVFHGDVTDPEAVSRALQGCDAVLHTANVYTLDRSRRAEMLRVNEEGTREVLGQAVAAGCDPVVHVSSIAALPPLSSCRHPYHQSKCAAERIAQQLQEQGAPVVITYPGSLLGPRDPGPGEQVHFLKNFLRQRLPFSMDGAMPLADVRWVARAHARLFEAGQGPRRVQMGGPLTEWDTLFRTLERVVDRRLIQLPRFPRWVDRLTGRILDVVQPFVPWRLPAGAAAIFGFHNAVATDDGEAVRLAGPHPPLEITLRDTVRWAVVAGHLSLREAGVQVLPVGVRPDLTS